MFFEAGASTVRTIRQNGRIEEKANSRGAGFGGRLRLTAQKTRPYDLERRRAFHEARSARVAVSPRRDPYAQSHEATGVLRPLAAAGRPRDRRRARLPERRRGC